MGERRGRKGKVSGRLLPVNHKKGRGKERKEGKIQ